MTIADILFVASSALTACCSEPLMGHAEALKERARRDTEIATRREQRRRLRLAEWSDDQIEVQAFGGPLWDMSLPIPEGVLPRVFEYAQTHELELWGVRGRLTALKADADGWHVTIDGSGHGRSGSVSGTLGYGGAWEEKVATGQWMECNFGRWRLTQPLPTLTAQPSGCDVRFGAEFQRPGWFQKWTTTGLDRIELRGTRARPFVSGSLRRIKTWLLPDLQFVEQRAARVPMEAKS